MTPSLMIALRLGIETLREREDRVARLRKMRFDGLKMTEAQERALDWLYTSCIGLCDESGKSDLESIAKEAERTLEAYETMASDTCYQYFSINVTIPRVGAEQFMDNQEPPK